MAKRRKKSTGPRERHLRFIEVYLSNGENGMRAYLEVYPEANEKTATVNASKLLTQTDINAEITRRRLEIRQRYMLTTERVMQEIARVAYFNPQKLVDAEGKLIPLHKLDADTAAGLSAVETEIDGEGNATLLRWKPHSKTTALDQAARITRLYEAPPPPPPADPTQKRDPRQLAMRLALLIRRGQKKMLVSP